MNKKENTKAPKRLELTQYQRNVRFGIIILASVIGLQLTRIIMSNVNLSDNVSSWVGSFIVQCICMGVIPYTLYYFLISKSPRNFIADTQLRVKIPWQIYLFAVLIGIGISVINTAASFVSYSILTAIGYQYPNSVGTIYSGPEVLVMEIITTCLLPSIFEELTDRGVFLATFQGRKDIFKILFVGLSFGLLHQNITQLIPTAVGGLIITALAVKTKSIVPGMIVHFMNNLRVVLEDYLSQKGGYISEQISEAYTFFSQNYLFAVLLLIGSVFMVRYLINLSRDLSGNAKTISKEELLYSVLENSIKDTSNGNQDLKEIFWGAAKQAEKKEEKVTYMVVYNPKEVKKRRLSYIPIIIALVSAALYTIFSFFFRFFP